MAPEMKERIDSVSTAQMLELYEISMRKYANQLIIINIIFCGQKICLWVSLIWEVQGPACISNGENTLIQIYVKYNFFSTIETISESIFSWSYLLTWKKEKICHGRCFQKT